MTKDASSISDASVPEILPEKNDISQLSGVENIENILRLKRTGVKAYYYIGMLLAKAREDLDQRGPEYFLQEYQMESWDEYLHRVHESRAEASRKILDYLFIEKWRELGVRIDLFFQLEDTDILRNMRVYFEKANDKQDIERVQEILQTGMNLGRDEFRKWVKSATSSTPDKISPDPLTPNQIMVEAWKRLKKWVKEQENSAKGNIRKQTFKEVHSKMEELYEEIRDS